MMEVAPSFPAATVSFPTVCIVVGFPPGGGVDVVARIIAQSLSTSFGQQFVVENRPGAGSNIATETLPEPHPMVIPFCSSA